MNYQTAIENVFAIGRVPDGYFGATRAVRFALVGQKIVTVADCGCFGSGLPDAVDKAEALWLVKRHPSSRATDVSEFS